MTKVTSFHNPIIMNNLICWSENNVNKWNMVPDKERNAFLLNLLQNNNIDKHTIFIIPTGGFVSGIWLCPQTHKSNRVDFWNFDDDFGKVYEKPVVNETSKKILHEVNERNGDNTKYGWISPEGKYFHCGFQGHSALAERICFGMADTNNPERYLEEHGWCKIYKPLFDEQYAVYVGDKHIITNAQMKTLMNMGLENAKDISAMLCRK